MPAPPKQKGNFNAIEGHMILKSAEIPPRNLSKCQVCDTRFVKFRAELISKGDENKKKT